MWSGLLRPANLENTDYNWWIKCASTRIFRLIALAQIPLIIAHAGESCEVRCLNVDLRLYLHPYFVHARSEGSGESAHMCRHARAFAARRCDEYRYLVHWRKWTYLCHTWFRYNRKDRDRSYKIRTSWCSCFPACKGWFHTHQRLKIEFDPVRNQTNKFTLHLRLT